VNESREQAKSKIERYIQLNVLIKNRVNVPKSSYNFTANQPPLDPRTWDMLSFKGP
jgi:hypothetical protein